MVGIQFGASPVNLVAPSGCARQQLPVISLSLLGGEAVVIKQTPAGNAGVLNPPNSSPRFPQPSLSPILAVSLALCPVHELVITKVSGSPAVYKGITLHTYIWIDVSIFVSAGYKTKCPQPFC